MVSLPGVAQELTPPAPQVVDAGLARPAATLAIGTVVSRVTGLLRLVALITALGVAEGRLADTFNIANTLPNILYDLILGGVISAVFVPLVVDGLRSAESEEADAGRRQVGTLVGTALFVLLAVSVLAALAAPLVVRVFASRAGAVAGAQAALATYLFRLFAFQIFFYGAAAIASGLLNVRGRFAASGFAPVANNVVATVVFLAFAAGERRADLGVSSGGKLLLGLGTTAAVAAMALVQIVPVRRAFGPLPLRVSFKDPLIRRFVRLSTWTVLYVAISHAGLAVTLFLANGVTGGVSAFTYAIAFYQLPCGVLAVSVTTALVPVLAYRAAEGDMAGFGNRLARGVKLTVALMVPATVAYVVLAHPLMRMLLAHRGVTVASADYVARILGLLILSLAPFSLWLLFVRAFYALQDARRPVVANAWQTGIWVGLSVLAYPILKVEGMALADSVSYIVGTTILGIFLARRVRTVDWNEVLETIGKAAAASLVMGMVMYAVVQGLSRTTSLASDALAVVVAVAAGGAAFGASAVLLDLREVINFRSLLRRT